LGEVGGVFVGCSWWSSSFWGAKKKKTSVHTHTHRNK
jgi:hypothetical protein